MDIGIQIVILVLVLSLLIGFLIWFLKHEEKKKSVMDLFHPEIMKNDFIKKDIEIKRFGGSIEMLGWEGVPVELPKFISCFAKYFKALDDGDDNEDIIDEYIHSTNDKVNKTSSRLIKAYKDVKDDTTIPENSKVLLRNVLPEVFAIGEWRYNLILRHLKLAGGGSNNTVFFIDIYKNTAKLQEHAVLRLNNQNLAYQYEVHQTILDELRSLIRMFAGSGLVRLPIFSSLNANHGYKVENGKDKYAVIWQVLPSMNHLPPTSSLPQTRSYINVIYGVLKRLHENSMIYLDWKRENVMCSGDTVLLTDTDLLSAEGGYGSLPRTQCLPSYFLGKLNKYKLNDFRGISTELMIVDNHIGIREMLLALMSMTGYLEEHDNYNHFMETHWYEEPIDTGDVRYNNFISSICSILNKEETTDDECLDFVFKYINSFLDIIESRYVDDEQFTVLVNALIEENKQEVIKMQQSFIDRLDDEPWPTLDQSQYVNETPKVLRTPGTPDGRDYSKHATPPQYTPTLRHNSSPKFTPKKEPNENFDDLMSPISPQAKNGYEDNQIDNFKLEDFDL